MVSGRNSPARAVDGHCRSPVTRPEQRLPVATASSEKRVFQMPDVTEMALAIVVGYRVVFTTLLIITLPGILKLEGSGRPIVLWGIELSAVAALGWLAFFVWGITRRARWSWYVARYFCIAVAVLHSIALIVMLILLIGASAQGVSVLPHGGIGFFFVHLVDVQNVPPVVSITFFLVDLAVLIAEYVVFFSMGNRGTRQYFGID